MAQSWVLFFVLVFFTLTAAAWQSVCDHRADGLHIDGQPFSWRVEPGVKFWHTQTVQIEFCRAFVFDFPQAESLCTSGPLDKQSTSTADAVIWVHPNDCFAELFAEFPSKPCEGQAGHLRTDAKDSIVQTIDNACTHTHLQTHTHLSTCTSK